MNEIIPVEQALERAVKLNVFTPTGLQLPDDLSDTDTYCIAVQITTTDNAVGWGRGDLALYVMMRHPDDYKDIWRELFPDKTTDTLYNDARTAMKYTTEERYRYCIEDGLSFGHCQKAGHLPDAQREDALLMARDNGWNVRQLEAYVIHGHLLPPIAPTAPSRDVRLKYRAWIETLNEADRGYAEYYVKLFVDWLESQ